MAAVWAEEVGRMLVFGGQVGLKAVDDFWSYDPAQGLWEQLLVDTPVSFFLRPPPRTDPASAWVPSCARMYVFGGEDAGNHFLDDLWYYDAKAGAWAQERVSGDPPGRLAGSTAVWSTTQDKLFIFGGRSDEYATNDMFSFSPATRAWARESPAGALPPPRVYHVAVWSPSMGRMFVHGGCSSRLETRSDAWSYDPANGSRWEKIEAEEPPDLERHTAVWSEPAGRMLVFAGFGGDGRESDRLWSFDPARVEWFRAARSLPWPGLRSSHAAVWWPAGGRMLVAGGRVGASEGPVDARAWAYEPPSANDDEDDSGSGGPPPGNSSGSGEPPSGSRPSASWRGARRATVAIAAVTAVACAAACLALRRRTGGLGPPGGPGRESRAELGRGSAVEMSRAGR